MPVVIALVAALAALLSYRFLEEWTGRSWLPAGLRALGWGTLTLLLFNASCPSLRPAERPLVLLDGSLSMQAAGGRWAEALTLARDAGEVRLVGPPSPDSSPSAGRSRLAGALAAARAGGRPVIVISDGEIEDAGELPGEALRAAAIRLLPRRPLPDVALTRVEGTTRLTPGDSLRIEVEATSWGLPARRLNLELREGTQLWLRGSAELDAGGRAMAILEGPLPSVAPGTHVLTAAIANAADSEPRDDARLLVVTVVPTPGIVLLASPPTWESRFLLETLRSVAAVPVRGYLETERGLWRRSGDLRPAPSNEVADAVRRADLLVTLGQEAPLARATRARGRWRWLGSASAAPGDWYVAIAGGGTAPVGAALGGLALDSFPPGTTVSEVGAGPRDWIALTAQAGRRGAARPVLIGRDSGRVRSMTTAIEGLWRWAFRGGSSEQGYRALVAASVSWLLGGSDSLTGRAQLQRQVVQRGRPAVFEWNPGGQPEPVPIEWTGPAGELVRDTLVFDGAGRAEALRPPGIWRYRLSGGGAGTLAVEDYSEEWPPGRVALAEQAGASGATNSRSALRGWVWLFGLAVLAFAGEWFTRRKMGLR